MSCLSHAVPYSTWMPTVLSITIYIAACIALSLRITLFVELEYWGAHLSCSLPYFEISSLVKLIRFRFTAHVWSRTIERSPHEQVQAHSFPVAAGHPHPLPRLGPLEIPKPCPHPFIPDPISIHRIPDTQWLNPPSLSNIYPSILSGDEIFGRMADLGSAEFQGLKTTLWLVSKVPQTCSRL